MEVIMKQARPMGIRTLWLCGALAVTAITFAALAGCTLVGDSLTGLKAAADGPTTCIKDCNDFYKDAYDREQKLHQTNVEYCQSLDQPDKGTCLTAEDARHIAAMDALGEAKIECQNDCHRQGEASGG
jgi:hypothetical protein